MESVERKVSLKKIEANRRNALRSTGPKTPQGKRAVRWNALKHGPLAKEVVIQAGDGKESRSEFRNLMAQLWEDIHPEGVLEEMLVEKIAVCYWRLRRVLRSEIGEIRKDLDTAQDDYSSTLLNKAAFAKCSDSLFLRLGLRKNSYGLIILKDILREVREEVKTLGRLSEAAYSELAKHFGEHEGSLTSRCLAVVPPIGTDEPSDAVPETPAESSKKHKTRLLQILDEEWRRLQEIFLRAEEREFLESESKLATLSLPSKEAVDKILRYETAMERQLYRAMNQLERLQRMRRGELIPPPVNIEVSNQN